jgi:hypothetical protein
MIPNRMIPNRFVRWTFNTPCGPISAWVDLGFLTYAVIEEHREAHAVLLRRAGAGAEVGRAPPPPTEPVRG